MTYPKHKWLVIRDHMWHSGDKSNVLTTDQHRHCVEQCDGYGGMCWQELEERGLDWDWSHVRDSADEALDYCYEAIMQCLGGD